jgi:DNA helicase HerA-like ATPase
LITGATGSGKSNAVAVIADRLSSIGAPVIIFDVHGEHVNMTPEEGSIDKVVIVKAEINPLTMRPDFLSHIIIRDPQATKQRRYLKRILISFRRDLVKISREENIGLETAVEELFNIKMKTHINLFRGYAEDLFNIEDLSELSKLDQTKKRFFFSYSRYISELKMLIVAREGFMKVLRID